MVDIIERMNSNKMKDIINILIPNIMERILFAFSSAKFTFKKFIVVFIETF